MTCWADGEVMSSLKMKMTDDEKQDLEACARIRCDMLDFPQQSPCM